MQRQSTAKILDAFCLSNLRALRGSLKTSLFLPSLRLPVSSTPKHLYRTQTSCTRFIPRSIATILLAYVTNWTNPVPANAEISASAFLQPPMANMIKLQSLPAVIGHRGAKQAAPENTIASIRAAKLLGVSAVEVDVMLSKDDVLFIHHDNTLDRCTNGRGYLWDYSASELRQMDAGSHFVPRYSMESIPLLSELLLECKALGLGVNLEIKHATENGDDIPTAEEVVREQRLAEITCSFIRQLGPSIADPSKVFFSSFSIAALEVLASRLPEYQRAYLVEAIPDDWEGTLTRLQCISLNFNHKKCSREQVQSISAKVPCFTYTVNDATRAMELYAWGVSGVFSDCPKEILDALASASGSQAVHTSEPAPIALPMVPTLKA